MIGECVIHEIQTLDLVAGAKPFRGEQWGVRHIRKDDVFSKIPPSQIKYEDHYTAFREGYPVHCAKIAWLTKFGWSDPITIDVGVPVLGYHHDGGWIMEDGYHRLCAAVLRGDWFVQCLVGGQLDVVPELFPFSREVN